MNDKTAKSAKSTTGYITITRTRESDNTLIEECYDNSPDYPMRRAIKSKIKP